MTVGMLAYGSLQDDPGDELGAEIARRVPGVRTPFAVEFARSSRSRDGAPTLVPVATGGARIGATLFELHPTVDDARARVLLYLRETNRRGTPNGADSAPWIRALPTFAGAAPCLYTALESNIRDLAPRSLAELAAHSAAGESGEQRRDGISYLAAQRDRGVATPLIEPYVQAVLQLTEARDLGEAWRNVRGAPHRFRRPPAPRAARCGL